MLFIDWYLPGFKAGGPIRSVANLVERLKDEFEFKIVTTNSDLEDPTPYTDIQPDCWQASPDGTPTFYFSTKKPSPSQIKALILNEQPDVIYLNSMYSVPFSVHPIRLTQSLLPKCKIVLAPRGMLSPGALAIKPLKKHLFLIFARSIGWYDKVKWHASSETEKNEVVGVFGKKSDVSIARNLTKKRILKEVQRSKRQGELKLVYIGRISPVKNLLQCLEQLRKLNTTCDVTYDIYGFIDDKEYWDKCQKLISTLPSNIKVNLIGTVENDKLGDVIKPYHFLFMLTLNENFGHAIVEALAESCPVIISNRTPWRDLAQKKAGWDLDLSDDRFIETALSDGCNMQQEEYNEWKNGAFEMAGAIFDDEAVIADNRKLFS